MFGGPWEEFMRLYGTAATHLKSKFPHLKIGGYGCCGFYAGVEAEYVEAANIAPNLKLYLECANKFLAAARDNGWPLDFFSFHSYSAPEDALRQVRYADRLLDQYGFTREKTKRVFNEWLPFPALESLGTTAQAAAIAAELIGLQNGPCDIACIYDARCGTGLYSALFNPLTQKPHKAYYAFVAFNELRKRGTAIGIRECGADQSALALTAGRAMAAAAKGADGSVAVMLANPGEKEMPFTIEIAENSKRTTARTCRITDDTRTWAEIPLPSALPPHSFLLIEFP